MRIKAGDLLPPLVIDVTDNGNPVNMSSATSVHVVAEQGGTALFTDTSPVLDNTAGTVTHAWSAGQTDTPGRIWIEVQVTWPGGKIQSFPPFGSLAVDIEE